MILIKKNLADPEKSSAFDPKDKSPSSLEKPHDIGFKKPLPVHPEKSFVTESNVLFSGVSVIEPLKTSTKPHAVAAVAPSLVFPFLAYDHHKKKHRVPTKTENTNKRPLVEHIEKNCDDLTNSPMSEVLIILKCLLQ